MDLAAQLDTAISKKLAELEAKASSANSLFRTVRANDEIKAESAKLASELSDVRSLGRPVQVEPTVIHVETAVQVDPLQPSLKSPGTKRLN
jgi:hypothetical protein